MLLRKNVSAQWVLSLLLLLPISANAWYLGGSVGASESESFQNLADSFRRDLTRFAGEDRFRLTVDNDVTAWKIYAGKNISSYFAVEAAYADLGDRKLEIVLYPRSSSLNTHLFDTTESSSNISLAVVGKLPVTQSVSVDFRFGVFDWELDLTSRAGDIGRERRPFSRSWDGNDRFYGIDLKIGWLSLSHENYYFGASQLRDDNEIKVTSLGVEYTF